MSFEYSIFVLPLRIKIVVVKSSQVYFATTLQAQKVATTPRGLPPYDKVRVLDEEFNGKSHAIVVTKSVFIIPNALISMQTIYLQPCLNFKLYSPNPRIIRNIKPIAVHLSAAFTDLKQQ